MDIECRSKQARSQDLERGGLFWKSEKSANDLDPNFYWSWISITRFVRKLRRNFSKSSEIQTFFCPKTDDLQKKKVFAKIETDFSAKVRNSNVFSAQKQVISKRKKKRGLRRNWDWFFALRNSNAFLYRITTSTSQLRHPISFGGAVFNFLPKIGLKSTKNVRFWILHKPMGGLEPPPRALGYATGSKEYQSLVVDGASALLILKRLTWVRFLVGSNKKLKKSILTTYLLDV